MTCFRSPFEIVKMSRKEFRFDPSSHLNSRVITFWSQKIARELILKKRARKISGRLWLCLIDALPIWTLLKRFNALAGSPRFWIVPVQAARFSMDGGHYDRVYTGVRGEPERGLDHLGILLTHLIGTLKISKSIEEDIKKNGGGCTLRPAIRRNYGAIEIQQHNDSGDHF